MATPPSPLPASSTRRGRVARAPLDELARLAPDEHAKPLFQELQPRLPAEARVLRLLRLHVGFARFEMGEPRTDARRLLGIARIGMGRVRGLDDLERAVDVLAIELEANRLDDGVDIAGIHEPLS
jgi:hypothetical protein